jgi:hypothetical protein
MVNHNERAELNWLVVDSTFRNTIFFLYFSTINGWDANSFPLGNSRLLSSTHLHSDWTRWNFDFFISPMTLWCRIKLGLVSEIFLPAWESHPFFEETSQYHETRISYLFWFFCLPNSIFRRPHNCIESRNNSKWQCIWENFILILGKTETRKMVQRQNQSRGQCSH